MPRIRLRTIQAQIVAVVLGAALITTLCAGIFVDQMRRNIEDLGPGVYDKMSYYERWCAAITNVLLQKNVITVDELGRKMAEVERRWTEARK